MPVPGVSHDPLRPLRVQRRAGAQARRRAGGQQWVAGQAAHGARQGALGTRRQQTEQQARLEPCPSA
jgi:hypothetical protein